MKQKINCFVLVCTFGIFWSCTHTPSMMDRVVFKSQDAEKQITNLREQLQLNPNDVNRQIELARIFLSEEMIEEAVIELEKAISIDPQNTESLMLLSLCYQKLPKPDFTEATMLLEKASQVEPNNGDIHLNLGQIYDKLDEDEKAISEFNKVIELSNDQTTLVSAHLGLMAIYKSRNEFDRAEKEYEAAYKIYPGIEEIIKMAEINNITPVPITSIEDNGTYPSEKERIKRAYKEIMKIQRMKR